jgi:hypothetical protein
VSEWVSGWGGKGRKELNNGNRGEEGEGGVLKKGGWEWEARGGGWVGKEDRREWHIICKK